MDAGIIIFHHDYDVFKDILKGHGVAEQSLGLSEAQFTKHYGYSPQRIFQELFNLNHLWSYCCKTIKKRDGTIAYKALNSNDNVNSVSADDIYFALKMDDWEFSHWLEMESKNALAISKGGNWIMKKPSDASKKKVIKIKLVFDKLKMSKEMLFGLVMCESGAKYPQSHPLNNEWREYDPFAPTKDTFDTFFKSLTTPDWKNPYKSYNPKTTIHSVPFIRDNIKPTKFSVAKRPRICDSELYMFHNFPNGIPFNFG
jgi:hypothetical protein|tara:strand:- start:1250 stop:2017 length:768 start_codon:yes stop_codon:yes gene_type:complete